MKKIFAAIILYLFTQIAHSEIKISNGLVIKKGRCTSMSGFSGNLVNRTNKKMSGEIILKFYDSDNDPIGNCSRSFSLASKSGDSIYFQSCNCGDSKSMSASLK